MKILERRKLAFIFRLVILVLSVIVAVYFFIQDVNAQEKINYDEYIKNINEKVKTIETLNDKLRAEQLKNESRMPETGDKIIPLNGYIHIDDIAVYGSVLYGRVIDEAGAFLKGERVYCDKRYLIEVQVAGKSCGFIPSDKIFLKVTP
ncbi:MAG: hypothetical protein WC335_09920 [Candidatus Omnitrophota bacterium]|jgi:cell division protein FtsB